MPAKPFGIDSSYRQLSGPHAANRMGRQPSSDFDGSAEIPFIQFEESGPMMTNRIRHSSPIAEAFCQYAKAPHGFQPSGLQPAANEACNSRRIAEGYAHRDLLPSDAAPRTLLPIDRQSVARCIVLLAPQLSPCLGSALIGKHVTFGWRMQSDLQHWLTDMAAVTVIIGVVGVVGITDAIGIVAVMVGIAISRLTDCLIRSEPPINWLVATSTLTGDGAPRPCHEILSQPIARHTTSLLYRNHCATP
jgi:hypothetical protein